MEPASAPLQRHVVQRAPRPAFLGPLLAVGLAVGGLCFAHGLRARRRTAVEEEVQVWVDPAHAQALRVPEWVDPRWLTRVQETLARCAPFALAGAEAEPRVRGLRAELAALSFVKRVERLEVSPASGLLLELVLREPVACISARGEYALVDADGVVLEGRWPLPPRLARAFLPVIGPLDDPLFARARAGDWLVEPEHTDAIDLALSMAENLSADERAALGRIVIDARGARRASVEEPGARLVIEGAREALFGRPPSTPEPGELPASKKWRSLAQALELYEQDPALNDWKLVDLRWDRPELALRDAPQPLVAAAVSPRGAGARAHVHDAGARDDSGPRVR